MKKIILCAALVVLGLASVGAQNLQVHYDFGGSLYNKDLDGRPSVTTTLEMFKPDKWGNTFFFVDMDYKSSGIVSAYWEIARELRFWEPPYSIHVEYNGGLMTSFPYNHAYLLGPSYGYNNASYTKGFTFTPMYKYIQKHPQPHNFQLTGTWYLHFAKNGLCTFMGFADWWREKVGDNNFIFLAEPQFWVNLNKLQGVDDMFRLSIGTEVELSHNFAGRDGFYVIPTLAVKWTFN